MPKKSEMSERQSTERLNANDLWEAIAKFVTRDDDPKRLPSGATMRLHTPDGICDLAPDMDGVSVTVRWEIDAPTRREEENDRG